MERYNHYTIDSLFAQEFVERPKIIWRSRPAMRGGVPDPQEERLIQIAGNAVNVVAAQSIRANIDRSVQMALELAAAGSRVLYLNSYAGPAMLRDSIYSHIPHDAEASKPIRERVSILAFPYGMMGRCISNARRAVYEGEPVAGGEPAEGGEPSDASEPPMRKPPMRKPLTDAVILNSFEFATFDYRDKVALASELLEWAQAVPITLVVFTQELSTYMSAGLPVRGPLGLLTSAAATVSKIGRTTREVKLQDLTERAE